jgi:response regulator RpfG family c-di-GMP phosphodiesterase
MSEQLSIEQQWQVKMAAMLSQIGCITLPPQTMKRHYWGEPLSLDEKRMLEAHPTVGAELVRRIPRLEEVAQIISYQEKYFDGSGVPDDPIRGDQIPIGARVLKVALDFVRLESSGRSPREALDSLKQRQGWYDATILSALEAVLRSAAKYLAQSVTVGELRPHMILAQDIRTSDGVLLISKGHQVSETLCQRLSNLGETAGVPESILVAVPQGSV